jgi:hypothetical protein
VDYAIPELDGRNTCQVVKTANYVRDIGAPRMNSRCGSRESSSSDLALVSSNNHVEKMPVKVTPANIPRLEKQHVIVIKEKKSEYLHRLERVVGAPHFEKDYLRHDGTNFPTRSGDTMRGCAVARGEAFTRNNEGRHVGSEIAEKTC